MTITRLFLAAATAAVALTSAAAFAQTKTVAITAIVEHPALDATRDGVIEALKAAGYTPGDTLKVEYQSAQGNPATAAQIARQFAGARPDVIVPISTPSAQAVVASTREIPVVFTAVTDPVGAQLVRSLEKPGANVTGVSDMAPVAEHVALIREIVPSVKRLGVLYNAGEPNSVSLVKALKDEAQKAGLTVVEATATKSADAQPAARSLVGKADAIYVPLDNTVVSALESVVAVGQQAKLPVFSADTDSVARGTVASIGFDYRQVGRQTGEAVVRILKGEKPGDVPVTFAKGTDLFVNPKSAAAMGVTIPEAVTKRATKVVGQ
ncbi:ABC transporter permease [Azospirillum baldaniorum]|uniref:ABC transporter substrate-binding component n=1 Tax=Azospirillum baldaniorum TaxID=1064539 RepID=A0A9P1JQA4_9PROT|nr:ABC transporter substrate-binding protein [Azospirillum baldaniorum]TWA77231.1 putative ABC transport system substrate-binding protein [Azospirillum brasilense]AWJ90217.1 ABC transporter permease [Azospirillum baldaniorum]NUB10467.1 ABC transporter substrate-binding protein [Azospirillum baldaniorum]TWA67677.1 putative ABC transport system substrate-binding protein [Azospirillum baldaniorum]CCC97709.1 putative ABC transporter; substrate-binding component [Azospirillum baldaniorum]